ncbi:MAG: serine/threonine protein kinase, partial [Myxococcales bacterium]|nr:serine/threonine protein kinase [Myxococcales bacterium]
MAEIYRAKPFDVPEFERYFAVKRILPNLAEDDDFIDMFVDEAKLVIRLNHPNIAQMYELSRLAGSPYIVMEYIPGKDLLAIQRHVRERRRVMAIGQAVHIISKVARALAHAHELRDEDGELLHLVHRDVSPQNVLVSYTGGVKLIDFGIAKVARRTQQETRAGVLKGKFSYMSPEQVKGDP